ncbi:MAG: pyridoxal phosphate-dependent aminotransferase [Chloroflexota bacterium]|nr:pyridoxal phosphate-dependent aminotransferase [Chloroflexota bacterium]MEE2656647.1 pyridoxal phosphate-dependent aminotransferase [Chloroflexota bacterium]
MSLANRMSLLGTESAFEVLARAKALEDQGKDIVHLEIGEPDFETPAHIKQAAVQALENGYTHYVPTPGIQEVRQSVARNAGERRGMEFGWERVIITPGAKPIMFFTLLALAEPGNEVIYPDPGFPIYESMINFCGAKAVPMQLREELQFHPDLDEFAKLVNKNTRVVILNSPHNPCGSILSSEELDRIAAIVREQSDAYILSDEVYKDLLYSGQHFSIATMPGMADRTIILDGLSKSYAMTGWRLGYGVFPEPLVEHITKLAVNSVSCANAFSQMAIIAALEGPQDSLAAMREEFKKRRDIVVEGLQSIPGIICPMPEGAFYAFPSIKGTGLTSLEFESKALQEAGVAVLSGAAFGDYGEGYVRLSYANSVENLQKAIYRLNLMVKDL